jgi:hypothetical protein
MDPASVLQPLFEKLMKTSRSILLWFVLPLGLMISLRAAEVTPAPVVSKYYPPLTWAPAGMHGQALVDREMAKHPEIKVLTFHVTPAGVPANDDTKRAIWFSSIGRIGKLDIGAPIDIEVYRENKEITEEVKDAPPPPPYFYDTAPPKYEVLAPLLDKNGVSTGIVVYVFPYKPGQDVSGYYKIAKQSLSDLKASIASKDDLFRPASQ